MVVLNLAAGLFLASVASCRSITKRSCAYPVVAEAGDTCASLSTYWGITVDQFISYNPTIGPGCSPGVVAGREYCVEQDPAAITTTSGTSTVKSTAKPTTPTTKAPSPTQTGLTSQCTSFHKVASGDTCDKIVAKYGTFTLSDFYSWNPAVGDDCSSLQLGVYVCVGVPGTATTKPTTTSGTGPSPTQTGIASDCTSYYKVVSGDTCQKIVDKYRTFTLDSFYSWNPAVGTDCSGLQLGVYVCVAVKGTPTGTTTSKATNTGANGIATPSPTHPGMMASNCNKFTKVNPGDSCDIISFYNGPISTGDFIVWNTGVGGQQCSSLQVGTYVCIGLITPTQPWNGVPTPQPTHPGMVSNCNKFVKVNQGDTCDVVAFFNGPISTEWFRLWNTGVGGTDCRGLQANTYACVGVIGGTPTSPGNGIATPSPIMPGMVNYCKKFTKVNPGDTCDIISFFNGPISTADFIKWNPGVGGQECRGLQLGTYVCIGV